MKAKAAAMLRGKKKSDGKKKFVPFWLKNKKGMKNEEEDKEDEDDKMEKKS